MFQVVSVLLTKALYELRVSTNIRMSGMSSGWVLVASALRGRPSWEACGVCVRQDVSNHAEDSNSCVADMTGIQIRLWWVSGIDPLTVMRPSTSQFRSKFGNGRSPQGVSAAML